jgi:hypothetical protein
VHFRTTLLRPRRTRTTSTSFVRFSCNHNLFWREILHLLSSADRNRFDLSGYLRINSRDDDSRVLAINIGACTAPLVSWPLSLCDDLQGGSVKIFYYHDVSRLIAFILFRSTSPKFPIHLRVFPFSLPSLPFSFCKVGNGSFNLFGCISPLYTSLVLRVY